MGHKKDFLDELLERPIEEIKVDIFFRADNFKKEPWYDDFLLYTRIGVCQPPEKYAMTIRKALKIMGYGTHTTQRDGKIYILPGERNQDAPTPPKKPNHDRER